MRREQMKQLYAHKHRDIVHEYIELGTLANVGKVHGITRERVRQILKDKKFDIRADMQRKKLESDLRKRAEKLKKFDTCTKCGSVFSKRVRELPTYCSPCFIRCRYAEGKRMKPIIAKWYKIKRTDEKWMSKRADGHRSYMLKNKLHYSEYYKQKHIQKSL